MEKIIEIKNLIFSYDTAGETLRIQNAIDSVTLDIKKGSFTAIIGRNGSGKSTLAKSINGLLLPDSGDVMVKGLNTKDDDRLWEIRQSAGMVFQNPDNQIVSSVVEDDVAFGPENLGIPPQEIRKKVDRALEAVRMGDFRKKAPHMLSGGQKQRIAIAGAIAMEPDCIIFDEPTAMLDPEGRKEVMAIIRQLNEKEITVVLITHMMEEAAEADRIVIMEQGKIVLDGPPQEIFIKEDELRALSLDVPFAVELASYLNSIGIDINKEIYTEEELIKEIEKKK